MALYSSDGDAPALAVWRTSAVPGATAPLRLTVARGQPVASGATVRTPPDKAAVFVSAVDSRLLQLAGLDLFEVEGRQRAVSMLKPIAEPGMLIRTSVEGGGGPLFSVPTVLTSVDISPDSQMVLAATCSFIPAGRTESRSSSGYFGLALGPGAADLHEAGRRAPGYLPAALPHRARPHPAVGRLSPRAIVIVAVVVVGRGQSLGRDVGQSLAGRRGSIPAGARAPGPRGRGPAAGASGGRGRYGTTEQR